MVVKRLYDSVWRRLGTFLRGLAESEPEATQAAGTTGETVDAYLISLTVPPHGASCPVVEPVG
ncbi:hypothetical protein ACWD04_09965 [Streptomyces sp. NPDC002911]